MRALEPRLFPYIWRYSKGAQLKICAVVSWRRCRSTSPRSTCPKRIVNDAITGKAFSHGEATASFLELTVEWPRALGGGTTRLFEGFHLDRLELLFGPLDPVPQSLGPDQRCASSSGSTCRRASSASGCCAACASSCSR
ncbi:hypothetical protein ACU4GR_07505 [Methylobacterium oryzae CBMB20]